MGFNENNDIPIPPVGKAASHQGTTRLMSTPKPMVETGLNISDPTHNRGKVNRIDSFTAAQEQIETVTKQPKGGPVKRSDARSQTQPSTSTHDDTGRPQIQCTTCGGTDHLRKDCHEDVFCTRCRTRSHATEMCHAPTKTGTSNTICIYCGSINHISSKCHNKPNNNREETRSMPRDLRECEQNNTNNRRGQPQVSHHQTRFDEGLNRQYSPNYVNYYQSPLGSIPGQDLSATLMELANIQSRSLEMMAASQRSQQEAFQELTRDSKDKANDAMFTSIKVLNGTNRQAFEDWINEIDQACKVSDQDFQVIEIFKKSMGAVRQVMLSFNEFTDDELIAKLRSCFSHAPTMNEAREELRNMRQLEHESVSIYTYRWGRALYRSSGIQPENERHPHIIKDFISSLKKNIRSKIANRWVEMRQPPNTVQKAFKLVSDVEKQLQVTDSFKFDFPSYPSTEVNELCAEKSSGDEVEVNEISRGKRWGNNNGNYNKSILISVTTTALVTGLNTPRPRIINKLSSGSINLKTPR